MIAPAIERALWPSDRLGEAIVILARAARIPVRETLVGPLPRSISQDRATLEPWVQAAAQSLELEADELRVPAHEIDVALLESSPAILSIVARGEPRFAALVRTHRDTAFLLAPDGARVRVRRSALTEALRAEIDPQASARVDQLLERAAVAPERRARAHGALLDQMIAGRIVDIGWTLGLPPSAPFASQLRDAGVLSSAGVMVAAQLAQQVLGLVGWWIVGRGALDGQIERGWLVAWGLVLLSAVPPRAIAAWAQGSAALRFAILLKRRLLHGALRLHPDEARSQGSGELLGRVIESSAVESLVTAGGLGTILAGVDVLIAATVLALAPGGLVASALFVGVIVLGLALALVIGRRMAGWTQARLEMTHDLVERMVGHRTRLAQEPRERWHLAEDAQLSRYVDASASLDRMSALLQAGLARAWLVVGALALAPGFVRGDVSGSQLAVAIGGLVLGHRAIARLAAGVSSLFRARVAWKQTKPLFDSGARTERVGPPSWAAAAASKVGSTVLEVRDLHFRYPNRQEPVLRGVNLAIAPRDRVLIEGPSGGGKSTLGAVLTGLRASSSGMILLGGLDLQTLGETGWRRRVVASPQFHENHMISATLAFNLLMGRTWPPRGDDIAEAEELCAELGLGPLLQRMPSGIMQMVGETGWQLSHGERSRVFIARALMQNAELMVLDESFGALDPVTLDRALRCVLRRAPALVVIAHP